MELNWTVGLSTGMFLRQPLLEVLAPIKEAGFCVIEVSAFPSHFDCHDSNLVARVRQELDRLGIRATSLHAPYSIDIDLTMLEEKGRRRAVTEIKTAAEALVALGGATLVIHAGSESPKAREQSVPRLRQSARSLEEVYRHCRELGIVLALEDMLGHLLGGRTAELQWLLDQLPNDGVGICLDTGHGFLARSLLERVKLFGPRLMMLHAHDNKGVYDDHLAPGEGDIDWPSLVAGLIQVEFKGGVVLEISGGENALNRARHSVALLASYCRSKGCSLNAG